MPNMISTACDFQHLIHPLSMPKDKSAPGIWRRISGVALLLLSIPFTLGILTGLYLYWAHRKVVQINRNQIKDIDATVQKLFGKQVGAQANNAQFVQIARSLYKGRTGEAFKQMKKLNDEELTDEAKIALAESAIERNQLNLIKDILEKFDNIDVPLHKAKTGAMVNKLIELGTDPNIAVDEARSTALHYAANLEVAKALKAKGAEIYYNDQGLTPLHTCTNSEVALFLLAPEPDGYNMDVNDTDPDLPDVPTAINTVPLDVKKALIKNDNRYVLRLDHLLHTCEDRELAELLLSKNVNVNRLDRNGNPPLFTVEDPEILKLLIEKGANVRYINSRGNGSCILHMKTLPEDLLDLILEKANETPGPDLLNLRDGRGVTPLFRPSSDEWKRLLIEKGATVTDSDPKGYTLLHHCSTKAFAQFLIDNKISVNAKSVSGDTPLHVAKNEEVANFLLEKGADINALNAAGNTPLMDADDPWLMKLLINSGADLTIRNGRQETVLHRAVHYPEVVKMILAKEGAGVDPNAFCSRGKTALMEALDSQAPEETLKMLVEKTDLKIANDKKITAFHSLLMSEHESDLFQLFLDKGAVPTALDSEGNSLLCYCQTKETAQKLIALGVDPKQTNSKGQTAIFHAASASVVDYLVNECGVDINQKDSDGRTPLHTCRTSAAVRWMINEGHLNPKARDNQQQTPLHAQCAGESPSLDIAIILIESGAQVNAQDNQGQTPLHLCKRPTIAKWALIQKGADVTLTDSNGKTAEILKDPFFS